MRDGNWDGPFLPSEFGLEGCKDCQHNPVVKPAGRKSIRLKGFDYSQPGEYFVTICTANRNHILGDVADGKMELSPIGKIVESCWRAIPQHLPNIKLGDFQIMPDHLHGIIIIPLASHAGDVACNVPAMPSVSKRKRMEMFSTISLKPGSLGTIIRSFKSAVTKQVHERRLLLQKDVWQSRFHDHIIRDDLSRFFIERYIELNPLMWFLKADDSRWSQMPFEELRQFLREQKGLNGSLLEHVVDKETKRRFR